MNHSEEINKIMSQKKISADVNKLREKISKENKNIIKLKVAQDTAYWDLKEKLRQLETNHEKLQQNMLEVQMQYETVSGQYQDELRHRAETLNKLAGTREICTVLEEYCERLRATLSRCKADQAAICEAYQQAAQVLQDMKTQQLQEDEKNKQAIAHLQEKLNLTTAHQNQLLQYINEEKQRATFELCEVQEKLSVAEGRTNELLVANTDIGAQLEFRKRELEKKEEIILRLQKDIKQLILEFKSQINEIKNTLGKVEKDREEILAANESLKQAISNQEEFTKTICEQSNQLQEKLAATEDDHSNSKKIIAELEEILQDSKNTYNILKKETESLAEKNVKLEHDIATKNEIIENAEIELQKLTKLLSAMDEEKCQVVSALNKAGVEAAEMVAKIQGLTEENVAMELKIREIEDSIKASKEAAEVKIEELTTVIESKDKDLKYKATTISELMDEVKTVSKVRSELDTANRNLKQELAELKDSAAEREKRLVMKLEQLEVSVKNKDTELSKNLSVILELRGDKDRLNETIQSMQSKIDYVHKELTRPALTQPMIVAEQDDNAVMLSTGYKRHQATENVQVQPSQKVPKNDNVFNFFSDSSVDHDNTIDTSLVHRRFEDVTRGRRRSQMPPTGPKNRRSILSPTAFGSEFNQPSNVNDMSLAQMKEAIPNKQRMFFKTRRQEKNKK